MSWHSDFKSFTDNLFPLKLRGNKVEIPYSKNEANKMFWRIRENDRFL